MRGRLLSNRESRWTRFSVVAQPVRPKPVDLGTTWEQLARVRGILDETP